MNDALLVGVSVNFVKKKRSQFFNPIFVIDSSNLGFPDLEAEFGENGTKQLRVLKYDQTVEMTAAGIDEKQPGPGRISALERFEVLMALKHVPELLSYRYVSTARMRGPA